MYHRHIADFIQVVAAGRLESVLGTDTAAEAAGRIMGFGRRSLRGSRCGIGEPAILSLPGLSGSLLPAGIRHQGRGLRRRSYPSPKTEGFGPNSPGRTANSRAALYVTEWLRKDIKRTGAVRGDVCLMRRRAGRRPGSRTAADSFEHPGASLRPDMTTVGHRTEK